ncbi:MAG: alpha/beta hydrolase [Methylococcales bacterium]|nr:alpha/beta hydrolase [Methylococcales bacterium]MBT4663849.1 alpha/beta hydrolase [Methylococcales bacterium]MBT4766556.1 alpha/beta hydrolase [Methylococcales bacterium]MBT7967876.1 alpha/beta hydrolase [Methylococcales bacterium]
MRKIMIYNHGKDSQPYSAKTNVFTQIAEKQGYETQSIDYRGQSDPDERVLQLLATDWSEFDEIVLVGSSMGAYVCAVAAETLNPQGLFLLAPAFYLPGYQRSTFNIPTRAITVVHGWQDTVVPPENSWKFCQHHSADLTVCNADHRLMTVLPFLTGAFNRFLTNLNATEPANNL